MYGWEMSQKLAVYGFEWVKNISQFSEDIIENYNEDSNKRYFLEVDVQCPEKKQMAYTTTYRSYQKY